MALPALGIVGNFFEASGPVIAVAGKDLGGVVMDMKLNAIAVELDLVDPAIAGRHFIDRGRQRWLTNPR
jgi:hypothetical protein